MEDSLLTKCSTEGAAPRKIIFHVDEAARLGLAQGNIQNMLAYYAQQNTPVLIELLLNAGAVLLADAAAPEAASLTALAKRGVVVALCSNALRANDLCSEQLTAGMTVVPAGVVELAEKQFAGYAYIRP